MIWPDLLVGWGKGWFPIFPRSRVVCLSKHRFSQVHIASLEVDPVSRPQTFPRMERDSDGFLLGEKQGKPWKLFVS